MAAPLPRTGDTGSAADNDQNTYRLRLYHTHTDEHIDIVYRKGDTYLSDAETELDYFLRDSRNGTVHHYDPRLFDLLRDLTEAVGRPEAEIEVVCGYRTPETNHMLRRRSRRVIPCDRHKANHNSKIAGVGARTVVETTAQD